MEKQHIEKAADLVRNSRKVVAFTGAGFSTPSGIPDFRSPQSGIWEKHDPMEVASLQVFRHHPDRFFAWFRPLAAKILEADPNPAHHALVALEKGGCLTAIVTQNIDGLHQRAGSQHVLEIHGGIEKLICVNCYRSFATTPYIGPYLHHGTIPKCPNCGETLKPDVILIQEQLPINIWMKAEEECANCDLLIVAGSSLVVMPAAGLPMRALENDAAIIVINKSATYLDSRAAVVLPGDVADTLPAIAKEVLGDR